MTSSIELRQKRAAKIAQARALVNKASGENRDFNDEEHKEWIHLMGDDETGTQGGEICALTKVIQNHEALETLEAELHEPTSPAIKPDGKKNLRVIKRSEFDALEPQPKSEFLKAGGTVED